jgi:hypothetical protein
MVAAGFSVAILFGASGVAGAGLPIPKTLRATALTYAASNKEGYGGDVAYAKPVSAQALAQFGPPNPSAKSCVEERCFALGTYGGGFQYPLISKNGGRSWLNGGHWFAGAWADGAAFASTITAFSAMTAVAWFPGQNTFYVTSTSGRTWYAAWPEGAVVAVSSANDGKTIVMQVRANAPASRRFAYRTTDGGRTWALIA